MPRKATKKTVSKTPKKKSDRNKKFNRLRGMRDILFEEYKYWDLIKNKAGNLAKYYGFNRIETPILEKLGLYERSTGKDTDIVSKEMYSFLDKSGDKIALRPEATPGIMRAYIEHGMFNQPQPVKTYWTGPVFRHEKPQSGRLRQHSQINFDIYGDDGPVSDAQLILLAYNFCSELQVQTQVQINSIGCPDCREEYIKKLVEFYKERGKRSKLCNDCKKRFLKNPLRLLDCKEESCSAVKEDAPQIVDFLCDDCREHFIKVLEYLDEMEVPYNLNPFLVRGLDYYNRTVFELTPVLESEEGELRKQSSIGGGGRYDGLAEYLGGRPTTACGFAIGIERLILRIKELNIPLKGDKNDHIFLAQLGEQARRKMFILFEEMRRSGFSVRQAFTKDSLKAQLEEANRIGARFSLILGQKELMDGTIIIRDMESGTQEVIDYKKINQEIGRRLEEDKKSD